MIEYFEEIKEEQIDFSKFIGRCANELCIKWTRFLKSFDDWEIVYSKYGNTLYTDPISYTEGKLSNLKYWDVFFVKWMDINRLENYGIFIWKLSSWLYVFQFLAESFSIEYICHSVFWEDKDVYKFNRY